jgi:hypothetical protein
MVKKTVMAMEGSSACQPHRHQWQRLADSRTDHQGQPQPASFSVMYLHWEGQVQETLQRRGTFPASNMVRELVAD